jgi:biotin-dependent carboxylase-like uncharacterized protein
MHQGVPPGGALVPALLARANLGAGNTWDAAALEILGSVTVRADAESVVATDDGAAQALGSGDSFAVSCGRARVRYLAVRGGIDVPVVLGSRSTLLVAALGGYEGRVLRKGDVLACGPRGRSKGLQDARGVLQRLHGFGATAAEAPDLGAPVRLLPGPDRDRFARGALDTLLGSSFTISSRSDRVGVRLIGPRLERADDDAGLSAPMVRGALQVPAGGEPIVLGPDHPTTGGYPVLATVLSADVGAVMARPVGCVVRFALGR